MKGSRIIVFVFLLPLSARESKQNFMHRRNKKDTRCCRDRRPRLSVTDATPPCKYRFRSRTVEDACPYKYKYRSSAYVPFFFKPFILKRAHQGTPLRVCGDFTFRISPQRHQRPFVFTRTCNARPYGIARAFRIPITIQFCVNFPFARRGSLVLQLSASEQNII